MLLTKWMSRPVVVISPTDNMKTARDLFSRHHFRTLPVVDNHDLVGLLTDRDLRRAEASDATTLDKFELNYLLDQVHISSIMIRKPATIFHDATLPEAAQLFLESKLEALPVLDANRQIIGIVTPSDVERAFLSMAAYERRGIQFGIRVVDMPGVIMAIIVAVRNTGARLASLLTTDRSSGDEAMEVHVHIYNVEREKLPELIEYLMRMGKLLYVIDFKTGERRVFPLEKQAAVA